MAMAKYAVCLFACLSWSGVSSVIAWSSKFGLSIAVVMNMMVTTMMWPRPYSLNLITPEHPGVLLHLVLVGRNSRKAQGAKMHVPRGIKVPIRVPGAPSRYQNVSWWGPSKVPIRVPAGPLKVPIRLPVGVPQSANTCPGGGPSECQYVSRQGAFKLQIRSRWRSKNVPFRSRLEGLQFLDEAPRQG